MDAPIGLFAPDGTTALLEFPHQAGMGCRAALHANQVPQSLLDRGCVKTPINSPVVVNT